MAEWSEELAALERSGHVSRPWVNDAIGWLIDGAEKPIDRVVDVGSGPGFATCAFAAILPGADVTAIDPTPEFLDRTRHRAAEDGVADRVTTHLGGLQDAAGSISPADLVWAAHVIHHLPDPVEGLRVAGSLLTDAGRLAVAEGGLSMRVLPAGHGVGRPSFVSRVEATLSDYFIETWDLPAVATSGESDWPQLMSAAGLVHQESRSFLLDRPTPVDDTVRDHVVAHYVRVMDLIGDRLDPDDRRALALLLNDSDPRGLRNRQDLFILAAYTVHVAARG